MYRHDLDFLKILKKIKLELNSNFKAELDVLFLNFYIYYFIFIYIPDEGRVVLLAQQAPEVRAVLGDGCPGGLRHR